MPAEAPSRRPRGTRPDPDPVPADGQHPPDDASLLARLHAGEPDLWAVLYHRWHPRFLAHAKAILGSPQPAEDAASEAILRICQLAERGAFPSNPQEVAGWIKKQGRNCALRQRGSVFVVHVENLDWIAAAGGDPDEPDEARDEERRMLIQKLLRRLPAKTAAAVRMRYLDRHSFRRIAAVQGGTVGGARTRVVRGILRIVVLLHSRKRGASKAEHAADLSSSDRVSVQDAAVRARTRNPAMSLRWLSAEVCRTTGIYIHPESSSAALLGFPRPQRS